MRAPSCTHIFFDSNFSVNIWGEHYILPETTFKIEVQYNPTFRVTNSGLKTQHIPALDLEQLVFMWHLNTFTLSIKAHMLLCRHWTTVILTRPQTESGLQLILPQKIVNLTELQCSTKRCMYECQKINFSFGVKTTLHCNHRSSPTWTGAQSCQGLVLLNLRNKTKRSAQSAETQTDGLRVPVNNWKELEIYNPTAGCKSERGELCWGSWVSQCVPTKKHLFFLHERRRRRKGWGGRDKNRKRKVWASQFSVHF